MPTKAKTWTNPDKLRCPECQSIKLGLYGTRRIARKKEQQYICKNCGRVTLHPRQPKGS